MWDEITNILTLTGLTVTDVQANDQLQLTTATFFTTSIYQTTPITIGGADSELFVAFYGGETDYDFMSFEQPNNGLYATVIGANQIQFSLNTLNIASFAQDHLSVTVQDANDSSKKVTIDLNIDTTNLDNIRINN